MLLLLLLVFSLVFILSVESINETNERIVCLVPVILLYTFIIGFQYEVGSDYKNYYEIFTNMERLNYYYKTKEYLFYYLVLFCYKLGIKGQGVFIVISFIQNNIFFLTLYLLKKRKVEIKYSIFIFLFLTIIGSFFMQMNLIRQYLSIYTLFFSILYLLDGKKIKFVLLVIIASFFHKSAIIFLPIYILRKLLKRRYLKSKYYILLLVSLVIGFSNIAYVFFKEIVVYLPNYSNYINSEYMGKEIHITAKISKLLVVPILLLSIKYKKKLSENEEILYNLGFLSFCLKICFLFSELASRVGEIFTIFTIFPIYFNILKSRNKNYKVIVLLYMLFLLIIKIVIVPKNEFVYKSYLFKNY